MLIVEAESAEAEKAITVGVFETCGCWNYKTSLFFFFFFFFFFSCCQMDLPLFILPDCSDCNGMAV